MHLRDVLEKSWWSSFIWSCRIPGLCWYLVRLPGVRIVLPRFVMLIHHIGVGWRRARWNSKWGASLGLLGNWWNIDRGSNLKVSWWRMSWFDGSVTGVLHIIKPQTCIPQPSNKHRTISFKLAMFVLIYVAHQNLKISINNRSLWEVWVCLTDFDNKQFRNCQLMWCMPVYVYASVSVCVCQLSGDRLRCQTHTTWA